MIYIFIFLILMTIKEDYFVRFSSLIIIIIVFYLYILLTFQYMCKCFIYIIYIFIQIYIRFSHNKHSFHFLIIDGGAMGKKINRKNQVADNFFKLLLFRSLKYYNPYLFLLYVGTTASIN